MGSYWPKCSAFSFLNLIAAASFCYSEAAKDKAERRACANKGDGVCFSRNKTTWLIKKGNAMRHSLLLHIWLCYLLLNQFGLAYTLISIFINFDDIKS